VVDYARGYQPEGVIEQGGRLIAGHRSARHYPGDAVIMLRALTGFW